MEASQGVHVRRRVRSMRPSTLSILSLVSRGSYANQRALGVEFFWHALNRAGYGVKNERGGSNIFPGLTPPGMETSNGPSLQSVEQHVSRASSDRTIQHVDLNDLKDHVLLRVIPPDRNRRWVARPEPRRR